MIRFLLACFLVTTVAFGATSKEDIEAKGLVDLKKYTTTQFKNSSYGHPAFIYVLTKMDKKIWRVTEGYPVTVKHTSQAHYKGRALDLTVKRASYAKGVCSWINKQPDFKCVNEYEIKYKHSTGAHLHITYVGL